MAINIKNYVDISTTFPSASVAGRSFGGLVFTANGMTEPADSALREAYESYTQVGIAYLDLSEVGVLFGVGSDEYKFATGYYGYISPSGRFASRLAFAQVRSGEDPLVAFTRINSLTNLFGSFTFLSVPGSGESDAAGDADLAALKDVAEYNSKLDAKYLFVVNRVRGEETSAASVVEECALFKSFKGTAFVSGATAASGYMPMAILGSTDYTTGQVVNFMFKQFGTEDPTVFDDATYKAFNQGLVNFYGRTQTNGQTLDFYQRGFNTDGTDTAIYCNEIWFKAACETQIFTVLTGAERLPANASGVARVELIVTNVCNDARGNGAFMTRESVSIVEQAKLRELLASVGGDPTAVDGIVTGITTNGYSVYGYLTQVKNTEKLGPDAEYIIQYYVFYGTADSVRYIKGNDILVK